MQTAIRISPIDDGAGPYKSCYYYQSQQMQSHLAAFDQAYLYTPVTYRSTISAVDTPRHISWMMNEAADPWSTWLARMQVDSHPPVTELLYEPAAEPTPPKPMDSSSVLSKDPSGGLDCDVPGDTDISCDSPMSPEDNIDPPPPPDPVGPPSEMAGGDKHFAGKAPRGRTSWGCRNGPLTTQSRENARVNRQRGPCWGCTLQRNQVRSNIEQHSSSSMFLTDVVQV